MSVGWVEAVALLRHREELVRIHSRRVRPVLAVDGEFHEQVHQSIRATTDDVEKRKEIARSKRAIQERIENGYDHGRPPFGLTYEDGHSWREIERETSVDKDTARRIYTRRERYLPANLNERSPTSQPRPTTSSSR